MQFQLKSELGVVNLTMYDPDTLHISVYSARERGSLEYRDIVFNGLSANAWLREYETWRLGPLEAWVYTPHYQLLTPKERKIMRLVLIDIIVQWWFEQGKETFWKKTLEAKREALKKAIERNRAQVAKNENELEEVEKQLATLDLENQLTHTAGALEGLLKISPIE